MFLWLYGKSGDTCHVYCDLEPIFKFRCAKLAQAYDQVIARRLKQPGRVLEWVRVNRAGNNTFRDVYDTVWRYNVVSTFESFPCLLIAF